MLTQPTDAVAYARFAPRARNRVIALLAAAVVVLLAGVGVVASDSTSDHGARGSVVRAAIAPVEDEVAPPMVPISTPLASPNGEIPTYSTPDGAPIGTAGYWYGYPMTMPIVEERGDWVRIMLPERPNGSTAWVRRADVRESATAFRIVVRLAETRMYVYEHGHELFSAPVGIGTDRTPTAPGSFFVAVKSTPGPPGYGSVVLDTSGHSEAIRSWKGSGDAITSIHGSISARSASQIGTTGTKNSNGCIRVLPADQIKLGVIPLGTPVDIVA